MFCTWQGTTPMVKDPSSERAEPPIGCGGDISITALPTLLLPIGEYLVGAGGFDGGQERTGMHRAWHLLGVPKDRPRGNRHRLAVGLGLEPDDLECRFQPELFFDSATFS